ncbi:type II toxin-antitoxin system HicA family toxin [Methylobacterium sp. JK268]
MSRTDHSAKMRDILKRLREDGWVEARKGPGDHVQFKHPTMPGRVSVDTGRKEVPVGTLRNLYRQAGWDW